MPASSLSRFSNAFSMLFTSSLTRALVSLAGSSLALSGGEGDREEG